MPRPRSQLISLTDTPYYHCVSRCVRRAFLCGEDKINKVSYEHRRQWVEDRLLFLSSVFAIDVCAYAVMSNHTHVVLRVNHQKALAWSDKEVALRWQKLFNGTLLIQRFTKTTGTQGFSPAEKLSLGETINIYRQRLYCISWFMRLLNEYIAREANKEDMCTGRFWEGRFKSQALLDETALAACMAYVDLNPIRAKMAKTPETSAHTSIRKRIHAARTAKQPHYLLPFAGNPKKDMPDGLPFRLKDYLELVELTGKQIRKDKRGFISDSQPILNRIGINDRLWEQLTTCFEQTFASFAGKEIAVKRTKLEYRTNSN